MQLHRIELSRMLPPVGSDAEECMHPDWEES